jgi:preprotein translocase subunit SecE
MAMNREQKRMLQRQGQVGPDGAPARTQRRPTPPAPQRTKAERTGLRTFLKEVRQELRKVAWPTRSEVINYSIIVLVAVVILTTLIASIDWVFGELVFELFSSS